LSDISIQFHALPDELAALAETMAGELGLHAVCVKFFPFAVAEVPRDRLGETIRSGSCGRIAFTLGPPALGATTQKDFGEANPAALILDVGAESESGLKQSWLAARTLSAPMPDAWRTFAARLRKLTEAGALAVAPEGGASTYLRNHRFTPGAKARNDEGLKMLPVAGVATLQLGAGPPKK